MNKRRRPGSTFAWVAVAVALIALAAGWAIGRLRQTPTAQPVESPASASRGALLFQANCANCHGPEGRGDGPAGLAARPAPRDFAARPWRFDVSRESIARVIRDGVPGTAMPSGRAIFSDGDVDQLVEHVLMLATSRPIAPYEPPEDLKRIEEAGLRPLASLDAPALVLEDAAGNTTRLADFKGKLVVLHFWGTACEHCLKEMADLQRLEKELAPGGLKVLHVCVDADDSREAQKTLDQTAPGLVAWVDANGLGAGRFDVKVLPTVVIVDAEGKLLARGQGARDWSAPGMRRLLEGGSGGAPAGRR
jgi:mono/diheme cytochrome c family protein